MDRPTNRSAQPQQPENLLVRVGVLVLKFIPTLTKGPQCGLLGAGAVKLCGWRVNLTFGQLRLPLVDPSDSSEPIVAQLQPVVRLIVAKGTLKRFAAALSGAIGPASGKNT